MIRLSKIEYLETDAGGRIQTQVTIDDQKPLTLWAETTNEYSKYLTRERSDAFIVGMINWAMRQGHDIQAETPMSESLFYQITNYLIPGLASGSPRMKQIKLDVPISSEPLPNAGFVGTGITCGVDSLYTIATNESDKFPLHKITHLTFFNVGSNGEGEESNKVYKQRLELADAFCKRYDYPLVTVNSNLQEVIPQNHFLTATYSAVFAILALQKMWRLYYFASAGNDYSVFTLKDNDLNCSEDHDIFTLPLLSTAQLRIESSGAGVTRQNKLSRIVSYAPSYDSLNVCVRDASNCSRCEKCVRTMIGLEALGELDKYKEVFDIDYFRKNKNYCYRTFMIQYYMGWKLHAEIYESIKDKIPFSVKFGAYLRYIKAKYLTKSSN